MIIGSEFIYQPEITSTNIFAAGLLKKEKPAEGTVIHAGFQSAGKGQASNRWESEDGKNLLVSIILYPHFIKPEEHFLISMAVSVGIRDFVSRYHEGCMVKWPNDIYVKDDKIAGILIENTLLGNTIESTVAGIGLNINQTRFRSGAPNPVSLKLLTGKDYDLSECLTQLTAGLDKRYKQLVSGKNEEVRHDYLTSLYRYMEWHSFSSTAGKFTGRILSVKDSGLLQLEDHMAVIHEFAFKEVDFIDKAFPSR